MASGTALDDSDVASSSSVRTATPWIALVLFCLMNMANQMVWVTFTSIATQTSSFFKASLAFVNSLSLVFMVLYIPFTFPASSLIERRGCRVGLLVGGSLTAAGTLIRMAALLESLQTLPRCMCLFAGQSLAAIGQPFITNLPPKIARGYFPPHQWALTDTIASASASVGVAIGSVLATSVTTMEKLLLIHAIAATSVFGLCLVGMRPPSAQAHLYVAETALPPESISVLSARAVCDRNFRTLLIAFSCSLGTFNTVCTMFEELIAPFGFTQDDSSNCMATAIVAGLIGCVCCGVYLDSKHKYRAVLRACFMLAACSMVAIALVVPQGRQWQPMLLGCCGILGLTLTPVMPTAFECSIALMSSGGFGETVLSGLLMVGGQIVGITTTLVITLVLKENAVLALWLAALGIVAGTLTAMLGKFDEAAVARSRSSISRNATSPAPSTPLHVDSLTPASSRPSSRVRI